jgi:hypothetical protein
MRRSVTPRILGWSLRVYRSLMVLYPDNLRRDFGPEMLEAFALDLSAEWAARGVKGAIRVWRITLRETIRIGLPAWLEIPAVAVPAISSGLAIVTQSPLLVMTALRKEDATPLYALSAIAIGAAITALTSFAAVHRGKRAGLISLDIG